jgi:hypothetical protein
MFMEGTHMVASLEHDALKSPSVSIKLLDLLTNRYHSGIVCEDRDGAMRVELPASSRFRAGQRVHFVVGGDHDLVRRHAMRRAFITQVSSLFADRLSVRLAPLPETAVA